MNPYEALPLYTHEIAAKYCNLANKADEPPHIFAIADSAFNEMMRNHQRQVAVISGESGAGKTESTKLFIRQLMDVSASSLIGGTGAAAAQRTRHPLEDRIIQLNPILEAFGNAQTVMNDNSSRFGKFLEVLYDDEENLQAMPVVGAQLSKYLLEKSRVTTQAAGESNFHIFYYLLSGLSPER